MLSFYKVFSSHAVVQRERPIVFSGSGAAASTPVSGTFAGQNAQALSDSRGHWELVFPAMKAGGPYELAVTCGDETITLTDLLVGEVWLCSGQSNMEMPVYSPSPYWCAKNAKAECEAADWPEIRLFDFTNLRRSAPDGVIDDAHAGEWKVCTPGSVQNFSACAYFFGRKLHQDLKVPVGLISTSWGGTDIQAWIAHEQYERAHWQEYSEYLNLSGEDKKIDVLGMWHRGIQPVLAWCEKYFTPMGEPGAEWLASTDFSEKDGWSKEKWEDGSSNVSVVLNELGRYVVRIGVELPEKIDEAQEWRLTGLVVNDCDRTYVNGVKVGETTPESMGYWAQRRHYRVPAGILHGGLNVIAVVADNHCGTGMVNCAGLSLDAVGEPVAVKLLANSCVAKPFAVLGADTEFRPNTPMDSGVFFDSPNYPCTLYNAMLYCFRRCAIRGIIWYQGCNNNGQQAYYKLHKMLIDGCRELWKDDELPFYLVQLAAFEAHRPEQRLDDHLFDALPDNIPAYPGYAVTREIQAAIRDDMRNVGMACIFDAGDHSDIHPRDKQTVGARLALLAEKHTYGLDVHAEGPQFDGWRLEGKEVRLFFRHAHGLHTVDGAAPKGFMIVDRNGGVTPAVARIEGETVVLDGGSMAQAVRYAFTGFCRVNVVNGAGLPMEPFRSDSIDYRRAFR